MNTLKHHTTQTKTIEIYLFLFHLFYIMFYMRLIFINAFLFHVPWPQITMSSSTQEKREHLYKILVIGELGTGKTSFIKRYVHQFFSQNYRATIGVDFALKVLNWDQNTIIRLQLWDIAGINRPEVIMKQFSDSLILFQAKNVSATWPVCTTRKRWAHSLCLM